MPDLTAAQQRIMDWAGSRARTSFVLVYVTAPGGLLQAVGDGQLNDVEPDDVRALAHRGYLRLVSASSGQERYELR